MAIRYPTKEDLHYLFYYEDGDLYWKKPPGNYAKFIEGPLKAGCHHKAMNTWAIKIKGQTFRAFTLIWIFHKGSIPYSFCVNVIDGNRHNHRIENLYLKKKQAAPGFKSQYAQGVMRRGERYIGRIKMHGRWLEAPPRLTIEEAHEDYKQLKLHYHSVAFV